MLGNAPGAQAKAPFCKRLSSVGVKTVEMLAPECKQLPLRLSVPRVLVGVNGRESSGAVPADGTPSRACFTEDFVWTVRAGRPHDSQQDAGARPLNGLSGRRGRSQRR